MFNLFKKSNTCKQRHWWLFSSLIICLLTRLISQVPSKFQKLTGLSWELKRGKKKCVMVKSSSSYINVTCRCDVMSSHGGECNLNYKLQDKKEVKKRFVFFILSAWPTLLPHIRFPLLLLCSFISPFVHIITLITPISSPSAVFCFSCHHFFLLLSPVTRPVSPSPNFQLLLEHPAISVAMQPSVSYKFDNILVLDYYLSAAVWSPSGHCSRLERGREIEKGMEEN